MPSKEKTTSNFSIFYGFLFLVMVWILWTVKCNLNVQFIAIKSKKLLAIKFWRYYLDSTTYERVIHRERLSKENEEHSIPR
jgi:hypothetical protein